MPTCVMPRRSVADKAAALASSAACLLDVSGIRPREATQKLREAFQRHPELRQELIDKARATAVMGNCPKTRQAFRSGVAAWFAFAEALLGSSEAGWPPQIDHMLAWSHTFRCVGTFCNYEGHVRTACLALDLQFPAADNPALRRARGAIAKRMLHTQR